MRLPALLAVPTDHSATPETTMQRTHVIYTDVVSKVSDVSYDIPFTQTFVLASSVFPLRWIRVIIILFTVFYSLFRIGLSRFSPRSFGQGIAYRHDYR